MRLPRVYPIVDSAAWVRRLAPLGVHLVQLRIKEQPREGLLEEIREAKACCTSSGMQLVINDYWELALAAGCDFVHLGQGDLEGADVPGLRRTGVRLGISTHDEAELARALAFEPDSDFNVVSIIAVTIRPSRPVASGAVSSATQSMK